MTSDQSIFLWKRSIDISFFSSISFFFFFFFNKHRQSNSRIARRKRGRWRALFLERHIFGAAEKFERVEGKGEKFTPSLDYHGEYIRGPIPRSRIRN